MYLQPSTIRNRIYTIIFSMLEDNPKGVDRFEMIEEVESQNPSLSPKMVDGCIWSIVERYPDQVYKPKKGLFRLVKYKEK